MENFIYIITYNGLKIAFLNNDDLKDYVEKKQLKKVYVNAIQIYKKELNKGEQ